ncbi:MAG: GHKL domain-containing protein [Lachnospiraceae bacterium]|nr:GHKL domain-containing protein [Lachnospiraceae bacterium]
MINVVTILFESITTWLCLHIVFGKKIEKRWLEVGFSGVYVPLSVLCSYKILNKFFIIFIVVCAVIWAKKMFDEKIKTTIVKSLLSVCLLGLIEVVVVFAFDLVFETFDNEQFICFLMSIFSAIISILLYIACFVVSKKKIKLMINKNNVFFLITLVLFFVCIKVQFEHSRQINYIVVFFFTVLAVEMVYMLRVQKKVYELENANLKLQMHNMYGGAYEELLQVVRMRQHDYKNQLSAICSMHLSADSLEQLIEMQKKYIDVLESDCKFDKILTKCNNSILAGYVYNLCEKMHNKGLDVRYDINVINRDVDIKTKEVIEIIGVLLTNVMEYYDKNSHLEKVIKLEICETNNVYKIEVENISEYIGYSEISNMFECGYSSKGENRGLGLYSVKNVVNKLNGNILVDNILRDNVNWLKFSIVI